MRLATPQEIEAFEKMPDLQNLLINRMPILRGFKIAFSYIADGVLVMTWRKAGVTTAPGILLRRVPFETEDGICAVPLAHEFSSTAQSARTERWQ